MPARVNWAEQAKAVPKPPELIKLHRCSNRAAARTPLAPAKQTSVPTR